MQKNYKLNFKKLLKAARRTYQLIETCSRILEIIYVNSKHISDEKHHLIQLRSASNLYISSSEEELKSLISNIVTNAVKYVLPKGRIHMTWYRDDDRAVFGMSDTNIGIAKAYFSRITECFYYVDKTRSRESDDAELRLAIVKHTLTNYDSACIY